MELSKTQRECITYYEHRYDVIAEYPLSTARPIRLADNVQLATRRCRFCGRATPEASFRSMAHALPEFLGNKSLISMNECDECNRFLAGQYEDQLAKWFGFMRTVSQIPGKKGVPTYKADRIRIEMGDDGLSITLVEPTLMDQCAREKTTAFTLPIDAPTQPYVPIRAAMALVKLSCSVCPPGELGQCQPAVDWLMERAQVRISMFPVLYAFTPGPNPYATGKVMMLRRKVDEPIPYLWCIVANANHRFQSFVPFCPRDGWIKNGGQTTFTCRHFPVPFGDDWQYGNTEFSVFDWSGTEPVVNNPMVTLNVDRAELTQPPQDPPHTA